MRSRGGLGSGGERESSVPCFLPFAFSAGSTAHLAVRLSTVRLLRNFLQPQPSCILSHSVITCRHFIAVHKPFSFSPVISLSPRALARADGGIIRGTAPCGAGAVQGRRGLPRSNGPTENESVVQGQRLKGIRASFIALLKTKFLCIRGRSIFYAAVGGACAAAATAILLLHRVGCAFDLGDARRRRQSLLCPKRAQLEH